MSKRTKFLKILAIWHRANCELQNQIDELHTEANHALDQIDYLTGDLRRSKRDSDFWHKRFWAEWDKRADLQDDLNTANQQLANAKETMQELIKRNVTIQTSATYHMNEAQRYSMEMSAATDTINRLRTELEKYHMAETEAAR